MKETLINLIYKYGWFVMGGLIGAIIHRLRHTMSFKSFVATVIISAFVGLCTGIIFKEYFEASDEVVFVVCSISGVFSKDILNELQELIAYTSEYVKMKLGSKNTSSEDEEDNSINQR